MSKGEALITADIHLAINPRDRYRLNYLKTMPARLERQGVDSFCILGDLCEQKDFHHSWMVNNVVDWIVECSQHSKVWILLGNHDYTDIDHPFFSFLGHLPNVNFITRPGIYKVKGIGIVTWLPHTRDPEKEWAEIVKTDAYKYCDVVFAHQTFEGAMVANGKRLSGVPTSLLGKKKIISGDIHVPQKFGQVEYVGSPYTIDFGDEWDGRLIRFCNGKRMNDIPVSCPQKRLITVAKPELITGAGFNQEDILKVVVDHNPKEPWAQTAGVTRGIVIRKGAIPFSVVPASVVRTKSERIRIGGKAAATSDTQIVEEFGKRAGVDKRTLKTGRFIMDRSK